MVTREESNDEERSDCKAGDACNYMWCVVILQNRHVQRVLNIWYQNYDRNARHAEA